MFQSQFDKIASSERIFSGSGSRKKTTYCTRRDDAGRMYLKPDGEEDLYDEIQSHAASVDIHVLLTRYKNGDVDALLRVQGSYFDATTMPKSYAELFDRLERAKSDFGQLPADLRAEFGNSMEEFLIASQQPDFADRIKSYYDKRESPASAEASAEEVKKDAAV